MFGHQDHADDNAQDQQQHEIDNNIQEFNSSSNDQPLTAPTPGPTDQPSSFPSPPTTAPNNDSPQVTLPDQPSSNQTVDLVDLKTKALDELYPIIHKLDLSAEENFKTLMMMIQATDNKDLISQAYEAAEKITDEGARAKALLDIVNEINYFTNHPSIDQ